MSRAVSSEEWNGLRREPASIRSLCRRSDPRRKTRPRFIDGQSFDRERALACALAHFFVQEFVVEAGSRGIGSGTTIVDCVETRPVSRRQAHGTWFATCVKLAAGE